MSHRTVLFKDDLVGILKDAVDQWNAYRAENPGPVDLTNVDLSGIDLHRANFSGANLTNANLSECDLSESDLTNANITGADLSFSDIRATLFMYATMSRRQYVLFENSQRETITFID